MDDRPIWATALYAGLRRGELMAIDWSHIDLGTGLIHVERSWDMQEELIDLKSHAGGARFRSRSSCATTWTSIGYGLGERASSSVARVRSSHVVYRSGLTKPGRRPVLIGSPCTSAVTPSRA